MTDSELNKIFVKRAEVLQLGGHDATLNQCLRFWHNGKLTFEESLKPFAVLGTQRIQELESILLEKEMNTPNPSRFVTTPKRVSLVPSTK